MHLHTTPSNAHAAHHIREEIAYLEARLIRMGHDGDCAYEKRLSKHYHLLLEQRRKQLRELLPATNA